MDHPGEELEEALEEESLSQIKTKPDNPIQLELPEYAVSPSIINITLELKGVSPYFPTTKPTKHESDNLPRIELTYLTPEWDPYSTTFQEQEEALMDNKGKLHE